ncbi:hypothetical protein C9994_00725 [Marivirga lumbricoides]|uniref:Uncharacterized protein YyaB-like PH domain-containing protein n=1 Tax=Marivirga lumbricoides TaxID=1046115 RepID=A0A2T4DVM2_9BACT|nr:hypothetical protein C9994_00725 [Marivirga lumbricoides]
MKYLPHKSNFFKLIMLLMLAAFIHAVWLIFYTSQGYIIYAAILLLLLIFLGWLYYGTVYFLTEEVFTYRSGFFNGKIPVNQIRKVVASENLWYVGLKIALGAKNGLIIHYNKFDEIFIAPEQKEVFLSQLVSLNPAVKIEKE